MKLTVFLIIQMLLPGVLLAQTLSNQDMALIRGQFLDLVTDRSEAQIQLVRLEKTTISSSSDEYSLMLTYEGRMNVTKECFLNKR